jgi:23S rRNA pseudouridine1911/1915/1917 synthase
MARRNRITWGGWELPVLFEDKDLIAISKPSGLLTVPIHKSQAISAEFILNQATKDSDSPIKAVHRIDRYTTGVVLFSKSRWAYQKMVKHFLSHEPVRTYLCWVHGVIGPDSGELVHYLKLIKAQFKNILADEESGGERARLTYKVLHRYAKATQVEVKLDTGFKNQIRVQFSAIGHSIVGERQYVETPDGLLDRQAYTLEIVHPRTLKPVKIKAPMPKDLEKLDKILFEQK